ncbi:MAG: hypothetical protein HY735_05875 [Verrucomicrobia bacterium]|nr:hypothetical protein [Verrucomicrobiota bacterium]
MKNPKAEEIQIKMTPVSNFELLAFEFVSDFGFRILDLVVIRMPIQLS